MQPPRPRAVAIAGPTAAGKTRLALALAHRLERAILACDSVQVHRGLDIGTAKPTLDEREGVSHFGFDLVAPDQEFSAAAYGRYARNVIASELVERGRTPIVCGGTGLYLRALAWSYTGDASEPARNDDHGHAREAFESEWMTREAADAGAVHRALSRVDPVTAGQIHPRNVVRAVRALWLCEQAGEPISEVRKREPPRALVDLLLVVIDPGVEIVDRAIAQRCEAMLAAGWIREVEMLVAAGYDARHRAMRSLGYREILEHLAGTRSLAATREAIVTATRAYARRQRTYFRHQFRDLPTDHIVHIQTADACPWATIAAFLDPRTQLDGRPA